MKELKANGFPMVIIFVIILMIVTVFSWKSCSARDIEKSGDELSFKTMIILKES